jgi:hypothetical protein
MMTAHTERPLPSTNALVASVVDSDTSSMCAASTPAIDSAPSIAPRMPIDRSWCVVGDLALATTVWDRSS